MLFDEFVKSRIHAKLPSAQVPLTMPSTSAAELKKDGNY